MVFSLPAKIFGGHSNIQETKNNFKKERLILSKSIKKFRRVKEERFGWRKKEIKEEK